MTRHPQGHIVLHTDSLSWLLRLLTSVYCVLHSFLSWRCRYCCSNHTECGFWPSEEIESFSSARQRKLGKTSNRTHTLIWRLTIMIESRVSSTSTTCHRQAFKVVHLSITEKRSFSTFAYESTSFPNEILMNWSFIAFLFFSQFFHPSPKNCLPLIIITVIISLRWIRKSA